MAAVILDGEGRFQRTADTDEVGVIAIDGPNVFSGYLDPHHNEGVFVEINGERWLNTGDLGRRDFEGLLLARRAQEGAYHSRWAQYRPEDHRGRVANSSGRLADGGGREPDVYAGELPVAYVQLKPGSAVTEAELLEHAARTIPEKAAIPKRIKISSSLPTTAVGKLFKPALVEREIEEAIRAEAARIGATIASIRLDRDPRRGLRAVVEANDGVDRLKEALGRYAVKSEVTEARRSTALPSV